MLSILKAPWPLANLGETCKTYLASFMVVRYMYDCYILVSFFTLSSNVAMNPKYSANPFKLLKNPRLCLFLLLDKANQENNISRVLKCVARRLTNAFSSSNSRHPVPSSRVQSIQPLNITQTPFIIYRDFRCT